MAAARRAAQPQPAEPQPTCIHLPFTIYYSLTDAVGAAADHDDDFAADGRRDAADLGHVGDEGAEGFRAAAHAGRGHGGFVVDVNPPGALAAEAVPGGGAHLRV